jgi:trans-AT polyketide synthase/acyltransferase/oxidoreductase domain-containing protein
MDVAQHLTAYGAARMNWVDVTGRSHVSEQAGGSLEMNFDQLGRSLLVDVLRRGHREVVLTDGELSVVAGYSADGARLEVRWGETLVVDEPLNGLSRVVHGPAGLGSAHFRQVHGVRYAYVAGAMAGGIASADLVVSMQRAGLLAFYGSGGVPVGSVDAALRNIKERVDGDNWGVNLLHNPVEPAVEEATVDLYLKHGVTRVSASAYVRLTPAIIRFRFANLARGKDGLVTGGNHVFAKVSRVEVAEPFLRPPTSEILADLVSKGHMTAEQAGWAKAMPVATAITAEADSGGHTDHRPLMVILPAIRQLCDRICLELGYSVRPFVGAAGGIGTPAAVVGAFAMGADYVLTGSINQASLEAGTSTAVKKMLADAASTDVASGPAPDMFEMGAKVQVLSRGSMYAARAQRLYDLYRSYPSLEALPDKERARVEKQIFARPIADVWADTEEYWITRDAEQVARAQTDARHKMALVFRWYLGNTSRWARMGDPARARDYQIWCGPSMGAFNQWARGGPLEALDKRGVVDIAEALMHGAAEMVAGA